MSNVLLILSPYEQRHLDPHMAAPLALRLKAEGARRADLTANAFFNPAAAQCRHNAYAVPAFASAARGVATLLDQVVGASSLYDLGAAMQPARIPGVSSLFAIARTCLRHADSAAAEPAHNDTRDLALVLYAALHAGQYDRLVFPHMTHAVQRALYVVGNNLRGLEMETYGRPVRLDAMRWKIMDLARTALPAQGARLH